jgi:serine/threonine-protein kinase
MPLAPGTRLGPYEIIAPIGAGGMGEVYRARDTKLDRQVAIKVLPDAFAVDPERLARFNREARTLASINHPHIAQIYGIEDRALVMELVEGTPLRGPLPLATALDYARQVAAALEAAHEKGIVHRDLKPGNIMVTASGAVKVLDFGLARVDGASGGNSTDSSTHTLSMTRPGMILGTPAYMSPEQARGQAVGRQTDIWAFGCLLYEMLAGKPAFQGENITDIVAAVMKTEPDLTPVPARMRRLVRRCLEKDPARRLRDIGDAWDLIEPEESPQKTTPRNIWLWRIAAGLLAASTIAGFWAAWRAARPVKHPLVRLSVLPGPDALKGASLTAVISPDGRRLVFPARGADGQQRLATRLLDQDQANTLPGTEGGSEPFFSPDSQWIGFFAGDRLKKISVNGGAPVTLCTGGARGASWGEDGYIAVALSSGGPLSRISEAGGEPQPFTKLAAGESSHRWPQIWRDQLVVFTATAYNIGSDNGRIEVLSLKTGRVKVLPMTGYFGRYVPTGHILYVHHGVLYGIKFDPSSLEVAGEPVPLLESLSPNPNTGGGQFSFSGTGSDTGILVYLEGRGPAVTWQPGWLDSSGKIQFLAVKPGVYTNPRVSPDGRKVALLNETNVDVLDLERDTALRLDLGPATVPAWAPDGKHLAFLSLSGCCALSWVRSDGAGDPVRLLEAPHHVVPTSFTPDGRRLAYYTSGGVDGDIWTLPLDLTDPDHPKAGKPELFLGTRANENNPRFSPDGRWIAYASNESEHEEVYVRPFPIGGTGKWQVSAGGGGNPFWSNNGREMFYQAPDHRIMVVDYTLSGGAFVPGKPRLWSDKRIVATSVPNLDIAPDGKHFLVFSASEQEQEPVHVTMWLNFFNELSKRIP